jgi:hypothetical protein
MALLAAFHVDRLAMHELILVEFVIAKHLWGYSRPSVFPHDFLDFVAKFILKSQNRFAGSELQWLRAFATNQSNHQT